MSLRTADDGSSQPSSRPVRSASLAYQEPGLAFIHDVGFGFHGDRCAPGILALLEPIRARGGTVLELGCGAGSLTGHLVSAGHRVIATDGSPAMLERARLRLSDVDFRLLVLPDDPLPPADAVVGVGYLLSYLADEATIDEVLAAIGRALRPGGVIALDVVQQSWLSDPRNLTPLARATPDWAIIINTTVPAPKRARQRITTFVRSPDGCWRRGDERHEIVTADADRLVTRLGEVGVRAAVHESFGDEKLRTGEAALIGRRDG